MILLLPGGLALSPRAGAALPCNQRRGRCRVGEAEEWGREVIKNEMVLVEEE